MKKRQVNNPEEKQRVGVSSDDVNSGSSMKSTTTASEGDNNVFIPKSSPQKRLPSVLDNKLVINLDDEEEEGNDNEDVLLGQKRTHAETIDPLCK
jgi:hypothetical protein